MQLGGMALRDGVLLQSDGYWAAAVREESGGVKVVSGAKARIPGREAFRQVPVLRGVVRLGEAMAVLPAVRRGTGRPVLPQEDPRLLAAAAASAVATVALRASRRGSPLLRELAVAGVGLAPVLVALRDSRLSRYHGAEHKSVSAYETGGDAAAADKEHARCGSNLIAPMVVTSLATNCSRGCRATRTTRWRGRSAGPASRCSACSRPVSPPRTSWTWPTWRCRSCCAWKAKRPPPEPACGGRRTRQSAGSRSASRLRRRS